MSVNNRIKAHAARKEYEFALNRWYTLTTFAEPDDGEVQAAALHLANATHLMSHYYHPVIRNAPWPRIITKTLQQGFTWLFTFSFRKDDDIWQVKRKGSVILNLVDVSVEDDGHVEVWGNHPKNGEPVRVGVIDLNNKYLGYVEP